jgi:hypothetical protein
MVINFERLSESSLRRSDAMWLSTVRTEIYNSSAISALLSRRSTAASTSLSRGVNSSQLAAATFPIYLPKIRAQHG